MTKVGLLSLDGMKKELQEGGYNLISGEKKKKSSGGGGEGGAKKNNDKNSTTTTTLSLQNELAQQNKVLPWTKGETDALVELARSCDLRWPVIIDRWHTRFANTPISSLRKVEDLQHRYYEVGSILAQRRAEAVMAKEVAKLGGTAATSGVAGQGTVAAAGGEASAGVIAIATGSAVVASAQPSSGGVAVKVENATAPAVKASAALSAVNKAPSDPSSSQEQSTIPPAEAQALQTTQQLISHNPALAPPISLPATGTAHRGAKLFDLAAERTRRINLDRIWHRSKEEEREEEELRAELRSIEAQLRKLKKSGKHLVQAGSGLAAAPPPGAMAVGAGPAIGSISGSVPPPVKRGPGRPPSNHNKPPPHGTAAASFHPPPLPGNRAPIDPFLHTHSSVSASFADTAPVPTAGTPYLQSGRLFPPSIEGHAGLNKSTLKQMGEVLEELSVPKEPIPTKRSCDLYDGVRKDALTLLILQKMVLRKEAELTAKKTKLMSVQQAASAAEESAGVSKDGAKNAEESKQGEDGNAGESTAKTGAKGKKAGGKAKTKRPRANSTGSTGSADGAKKKARKKSAASAASAPSASVSSVVPNVPPSGTIPPVQSGAAVIAAPAVPSSSGSVAVPPNASSAAAPAAQPGKAAKKAGRKPGRKKKSS